MLHKNDWRVHHAVLAGVVCWTSNQLLKQVEHRLVHAKSENSRSRQDDLDEMVAGCCCSVGMGCSGSQSSILLDDLRRGEDDEGLMRRRSKGGARSQTLADASNTNARTTGPCLRYVFCTSGKVAI